MSQTDRFFVLLLSFLSFITLPAVANAAIIINAEDFDEKTSGADDEGEWLMEDGGYLLHNVTFEQDGFYTFDFFLKGTRVNAVYPEIQIDLDESIPLADASVDDQTRKRYRFQSTVTSGAHAIKLTYTNPFPGRQLRIDRVEINSGTIDEESQFLNLADTFMRLVPEPASYSIMDWRIVNAFYGLIRAYDFSKDVQYLNYVLQWANAHIDGEGNFDETINDAFPGGLLLELYRITDDRRFLQAGLKVKDYVDNEVFRLENGAITHAGDSQLWDDTLFGIVRFYIALAKATGELSVLDDGARQLLLHDAELRDQETGLWYHGWDQNATAEWADARTGLSPEFWGRGNGWIIASAVDLLELLPEQHADREAILEILEAIANGLKATQHSPSGMWYTVLTKPEEELNYLETSATSLFSYGLQRALTLGLLEPSFTPLAITANDGLNRVTLQKENGDLFVTHISQGTNVGGTEYYFGRGLGDGFEYTYGHGVFLEAKFATVVANSIPLPVELNTFDAMAAPGGIELSWVTVSEYNNFGFNVLRSRNGIDFTRVGFVQGQGTTNVTQSYHFVDNKVDTGTYHYKLEQIDVEGKTEFSSVISVTVQPPATFRIFQNYPNPFNPKTVIGYQLPVISNVELTVYNLAGEKVAELVSQKQPAGEYKVEWDASRFASSTYMCRFQAGGYVETKKLVLLK
jgi:unsaturated rhamnogalacturonyl hydrolase